MHTGGDTTIRYDTMQGHRSGFERALLGLLISGSVDIPVLEFLFGSLGGCLQGDGS